MQKSDFIIFFTIVLVLYGALNFYIFLKGWGVFPAGTPRVIYSTIFIVIALSYLVGRLLERITINEVSTTFIWIGSFWLAAMTYFFFLSLAIDILRLADYFLHFFPSFLIQNPQKTKTYTAILSIILVSGLVIVGYMNARNPRIRTLEIDIPKNGGSFKTLSIAVASDIHLGTLVRNSWLENIVEKINALESDIVLLAGDVLDEDVEPVIRLNHGETLKKIRSKLGIYAVTGNHEYIGGVENAVKYLTEHNINILRDSSLLIANSFYIVGREDHSIRQFRRKERKPLESLFQTIDRSKPIILMDHQPFHLEEAEKNGVDVQISGHTHHGQIWPLNLITKRVYELSWGYKTRKNTHFYVSSGTGTWGPPIRIGNTPEIIHLKLKFQ